MSTAAVIASLAEAGLRQDAVAAAKVGMIAAAVLAIPLAVFLYLAWHAAGRQAAEPSLCPWCDGTGLDDRGWPAPDLCDCTGPCGRMSCPARPEAVARG